MAFAFQQRQVQRQVISPSMLMESALLQLPIGDLVEEVRREIDSNPALEVVERPVPKSFSGAADTGDWVKNIADSRGETLDEHLIGELRMDGVNGRELELCRAVVAELDSDGRFKGEIPSMMMVTGATEMEIEAARARVMRIDPAGCGAKNLAECFLSQLHNVPAAKRSKVKEAIDRIAETGGAGFDFPPDVISELKKLNPFPGRLFDFRRTDFVTPDITVDSDGEVTVDQRDIPEVAVSAKYVAMAKDPELDEETRSFAAERVRRARAFKEGLVRRQETMEKIACAVMECQRDFVQKGLPALKKLTMSEVARKAKCTVSTVSRAAQRKYVRTPRGTIALRRFFTQVDGDKIEALRKILNQKGEGAGRSDREISELMAKAGFKMARRTVAKYRLKIEGEKQR